MFKLHWFSNIETFFVAVSFDERVFLEYIRKAVSQCRRFYEGNKKKHRFDRLNLKYRYEQ